MKVWLIIIMNYLYPYLIKYWCNTFSNISICSLVLIFRTRLVKNRKVYDTIRIAAMLFCLVWVGWIAGAQLTIVNILNYIQLVITDNFNYSVIMQSHQVHIQIQCQLFLLLIFLIYLNFFFPILYLIFQLNFVLIYLTYPLELYFLFPFRKQVLHL